MGLYSAIDRKILLPIGEKIFHRNLTEEYNKSLKREWLSKEELYDYQSKRLQQLVCHCYAHVPYYRNLLDSLSMRPEDIQSREDLIRIPILTKEQIREHYAELISTDYNERRYIHGSTGGSTGTPMQFLEDFNTWNRLRATNFRMWHSAGYEIGDRMFTLGGNSLVKPQNGKRRITVKDIYDVVIMRNMKRNCTDITTEALSVHYKKMISYKPKAIRGYASSLFFLAKYIEQNELPIPEVVAIFTTGEKLHPAYRLTIQRVFKAAIFDGYGASDGGIGAYECPLHEGLHITEENCIVEIVDDQGRLLSDGATGHVITTDLNNYVFPFLRYKVGDLAYIKPGLCSCGRQTRLLGEVVGREGKAIYNKQGRPFSSIVIDNMMFPNLDYHKTEHQRIYEKMSRFQVRQDRLGDLTIYIVPTKSSENIHVFDYVIENFKTYFPDSKVELKFVDTIPSLPSGKEDYCISEYVYE